MRGELPCQMRRLTRLGPLAILGVWPFTGSFLHIPMDKPAPRDEGGFSEAALEQLLEAQTLGLWPLSDGAEDILPSEDSDIS